MMIKHELIHAAFVVMASLSCAIGGTPAAEIRNHDVVPIEPLSGPRCGESDIFDFQNKDPLDFLGFLQGRKAVIFDCRHEGWIKESDIPVLLDLFDENQPCGWVAMSISSFYEAGASTIGEEAAFMVMGFRKGQ